MRSCTAIMKFVDVTALKDSAVSLSNNQMFSNAALFKKQVPQLDYATLERNQFILDGSKDILQEQPADVAFWSYKSDDAGTFEDVSSVEIQFTENHSSAGITLYFVGKYPKSVRITWYTLEGTVLDRKVCYPDSLIYVCKNMVQNYGKLSIEILETQFPDSYCRMQYILYGLELNWNEDMIKKASIAEDVDVTGATLPKNTASVEIVDVNNDFDIENMNGEWRAVQNSQEVYLNAVIDGKEYSAGTFYIKDFSFKKNVASFSMTDAVGLLDGQIFYDGRMYVNKKAGELLEEIFSAAGFSKYDIDPNVYNAEICGYLGIKSCRQCIKEVCFAVGAVANDSRSDILHIYYPDRYVKHNIGTDRKILGETSVALDEYVSGVSIECSKYSESESETELYNDILEKGITRITFTMPCVEGSLNVTGGTLVKASTNYVDIRMEDTGICTVSGITYQESSFTFQKNVDILPAGAKVNVKKYGKCSLYSASKLPEISKKLLDYYALQKTLKMKFFCEEEKAGEWANVMNINRTVSYTLIEKLSTDLVSGFITTATCRGYNKSVTELYFTGSELYAGGSGVI